MDGIDANINDQTSSDFEDMVYWQYAIPQKRFYPTMDDIINNNVVEIVEDGLTIQTRTLNVIQENTSYDITILRNEVKKEKNMGYKPEKQINPLKSGEVLDYSDKLNNTYVKLDPKINIMTVLIGVYRRICSVRI